MMHSIDQLRKEIEPLRQRIAAHPVYPEMKTLDSVRLFMQYHVYAVWDFMSLLKSLQRELTCVSIPWFPVGTANTRYLINEIVTGEESDVDPDGARISHFELYLQAMRQAGADTAPILIFLDELRHSGSLDAAFQKAGTPEAIQDFVKHTFSIIQEHPVSAQAAVFTFGREDLIPEMFLQMIRELDADAEGSVDIFRYYIERHIEVDGGHHSQLALEMTSELCGNEAQLWEQALQQVKQSLQMRLKLWDAAAAAMNKVALVNS
jgi:Protein of unknown function (DUF3050)